MIRVAIDRPAVATGEVLEAQINWSADGERRARRIIVAAEWETDGTGNRARGFARWTTFIPEKGARESTFPVRLLIPHEGPVSFRGQLIHVNWKLRVRVDQMGFDEFSEAEFVVKARRR